VPVALLEVAVLVAHAQVGPVPDSERAHVPAVQDQRSRMEPDQSSRRLLVPGPHPVVLPPKVLAARLRIG